MKGNNIIKLTYPIEGMTCANCSARIERTLNKTNGVIKAQVDLASEIATLEIDDIIIKPDAIKTKIESLGYKVLLKTEDTTEKEFSEKQNHELKKQRLKFWLSLILTAPVMILSMNWFYVPGSVAEIILLNSVIILFTTVILFYSGSQFLTGFYKSIKSMYPDMNTLVSIGTLSAYIYSLVEFTKFIGNPHMHSPHLYFDTTATIITFILLGKYLEKKSKNSSADAVKSLLKLQSHDVTIIRNGQEFVISSEFIKLGDIIIIHPGESIPVDGITLEGNASIDESFITGESIPIDKKNSDPVVSGSICISGALKIEAQKVGKDTYLSSIIELIKKAQSSKPPIQKLVDKVAAIFVPAILAIAAATFIYWNFFSNSADSSFALVRFVSVLIVSCPCSLGLATPTAIIAALGLAARNNIYFKDIDSIEKVKKIDTIVFDKTGTVTDGILEVKQIGSFNSFSNKDIIRLAASGEYYSEHPVGKAIVKKSKELNIPLNEITEFKSLAGYGISYNIDGKNILIGNYQLVEKKATSDLMPKLEKYSSNGELSVIVCVDDQIVGIISLSDSIKEDSIKVIKKFRDMGIETNLLSGDSELRTRIAAKQISVDNYFANVKPEEKLEIISGLQEKGKIVAMVGDGINDAPALTKADVSMAFLSGTDAAVNSSHITLTKNDLNSVYKSIIISNKTMRIIKQNLFWAFIYNLICIPIAAGLFSNFGITMNPSLAALAMAFSSVSVVSNSLRIKRMGLYDTK